MQDALGISSPAALRLAEQARLECDWRAGVFTLRVPEGAIPLNRVAARVLALCDGRNSSRDVLALLASGDRSGAQARHIDAFITAARSRRWIVEAPDLV